jgi:hypothetical protein
MKAFALFITVIFGIGSLTPSLLFARGPAGGMGFGALARTGNAPRAGHVADRYGLYTARPYNPGPTYGPALRNLRSSLPAPTSAVIPPGKLGPQSRPRIMPQGVNSRFYFDYYSR